MSSKFKMTLGIIFKDFLLILFKNLITKKFDLDENILLYYRNGCHYMYWLNDRTLFLKNI